MRPFLNRRAGPASPIDLAFLAEQTAGDEALEAELLALFARQARDILGRIAMAGSGATSPERLLLLHTLTGSARAIGARDVAAEAHRLEQAHRSGALPQDPDALQRSVTVACAFIDELATRTT